MKTFSEACGLYFRQDQPGAEQAMIEAQTRYDEIVEKEILGSPQLEAMLMAFNKANLEAGLSITSVVVNAFIMGVKVGMEMERQELPKV